MSKTENAAKIGIYGKLVKLMDKCSYIQKDAENKDQKYRYPSAEAILGKVNPALVELNMLSIPKFTLVSEKDKPTAKGAIWQLVTVQLELQIIDAESAESITVFSLGSGTDSGDKAVAKAETMALKYAWKTALNMETGDDPEADTTTDKQTFVQGPPPAPALPPGLPNSQTTYSICNYWQRLGWDVNSLPGYLSQRFSKPSDQVIEAELLVILNESVQYLRAKGEQV